MREIFDAEILDRSMWNIYQTMKDDNFQFDEYSIEDKSMMINSILPYFEKIEEYEICQELKNQITPGNISQGFTPILTKNTFQIKIDCLSLYKKLKNKKNMKLELENALCIIKMGWSTKEEKELFDIAYDIVNKKSKILHLEYQKSQIENKLETYKSEE